MAKLPNVIHIGPVTYDVKLVRKLDVLGETDCDNSEITILRTGQSRSSKRVTLLHEILHAVIGESAVRPDGHHKLPYVQEEALVSALAPWLTAVLRDNPAVVAYLTADQ